METRMIPDNVKSCKPVLVIDDELSVCELIENILQTYQPECEVVTVSNGTLALAQIEHREFELVITNYNLPEINGLVVAYCVRELWPGTHIILISGDPPSDLPKKVEQFHLDGFLRKPFSPVKLVEMVQTALGNSI